jgi:hypothetical protein
VYAIAAAAVLAVAVVVVAIVLLVVPGSAPRPHLRGGHTAAAVAAPLPTLSAIPSIGATAPPLGVQSARALVVRYLDDVNTRDRADAQSLICPRLSASWSAAVDGPTGDFTVSVVRAVFRSAAPTPAGSDGDAAYDLSYTLEVRSPNAVDTASNSVVFRVVQTATGPQLCGES